MKDFLKDIGFFLKKFYDKSTNKFLTVETNVKEVEHDVIRKIKIYFNDKEASYIKEGTLVIGFDLSKYIHVKNLEELIIKLNDEYEKSLQIYSQKYNITDNTIKNRYCYMYFSSYLTYYEAKNIFALLNLSREYFIDKYISTAILLSNNMMNIFVNIAKDIFSWTQYSFTFTEEQNIDDSYISKINFARISHSVKDLNKIETLENNYLSGTNKIQCAVELFFLYNKTKNYTKFDDIHMFIQNNENVPINLKNYLWIIYYKDYNKSHKYIKDLLSKDVSLFSFDFFNLKEFIFELMYSNVPNKIYIELLSLMDLKLKEDNTFLCSSIFNRSMIYLFMEKDSKTILKSFYDFIEIINECENLNNELIESLFYIMKIEIYYENNHESVIDLYSKYREFLYKEIDNNDIAEMLSSIFYLVSISFSNLKSFDESIHALLTSMDIKERTVLMDTELIRVYFSLAKIYFEQFDNEEKLKEFIKKIHKTIEYINSNVEIDSNILMHYLSVVSGYIACNYIEDAYTVLSDAIKEIKKNKKIKKIDKIYLDLFSLFLLTKVNIQIFESNYIKDSLRLINDINEHIKVNEFPDGYQLKEAYVYLLISVCRYFVKIRDSHNSLIIMKELYSFIIEHVDLKFLHLEKQLNYIEQNSITFKHSLKITRIIRKINNYLSV